MSPPPPRPTHYEILSLPPASALPPRLLKKAYHRTLLLHHPDKSPSGTTSAPRFTVDEITAAYTALSTPQLRHKYDQQLKGQGGGREEGLGKVLQTVDLDDFRFEEETARWTRECRCGEAEGFIVTEGDLEEGGEVVVGCCGCSLWVRVGYEIICDDDASK